MYLGLDTSAYTSSVAIVDDSKQLIWENRRLLEVPLGEKGLAQSEALFKHLQVLPEILALVPSSIWQEIKGIGVSTTPRPVEGSYMPVFTAGITIASSLASALNVDLVKTSHQEGHLAAGLESADGLDQTAFLAIHLSGGTTEILQVRRSRPGRYSIMILGGSSDLHAGQFIDRVGTRLGLRFPAGSELEKLALKSSPGSASMLPSSVKGYEMSFSGVESAVQRLIEEKKRPADLARAVEGCIVRTLAKVVEKAILETGINDILVVGGVASNKYIRNELEKKIRGHARFHWAKPDWSTDNSIGVALIAREVQLADLPLI